MHVASIILMLITPVRSSFRRWWLNACAAVCSWFVIIKSGNEIQCGNARHELNCLFYSHSGMRPVDTHVRGTAKWMIAIQADLKPQCKLLRTTNTFMNVSHMKIKLCYSFRFLFFREPKLWPQLTIRICLGFAFLFFLIEFNFRGMTRHATWQRQTTITNLTASESFRAEARATHHSVRCKTAMIYWGNAISLA